MLACSLRYMAMDGATGGLATLATRGVVRGTLLSAMQSALVAYLAAFILPRPPWLRAVGAPAARSIEDHAEQVVLCPGRSAMGRTRGNATHPGGRRRRGYARLRGRGLRRKSREEEVKEEF